MLYFSSLSWVLCIPAKCPMLTMLDNAIPDSSLAIGSTRQQIQPPPSSAFTTALIFAIWIHCSQYLVTTIAVHGTACRFWIRKIKFPSHCLKSESAVSRLRNQKRTACRKEILHMRHVNIIRNLPMYVDITDAMTSGTNLLKKVFRSLLTVGCLHFH